MKKKSSSDIKAGMATIKIEAISLVNCHYAQNDLFQASEETELQLNFQFGIGRIFPSPQRAHVRFGVTLFPDVAQPPFRLSAEFEGQFTCGSDEQDSLKEFTRYAAISILIPYLRQFVSGIVAQSGFAHVTLPLIDVQKLVDSAESAGPGSVGTF